MILGPAIALDPLPAGLAAYQTCLDARPLLLKSAWVDHLERIQRLLLRALQGLLQQESTADFLELEGAVRDQLRQAANCPLRLGCLRPDFLVDSQRRPWICEINARFPVNGFLASAYVADQFTRALPQYLPTCRGEAIRQALKLPAGSFIVKGREPGWDIHQLSREQHAPILDALPPGATQVVLELHQDELLRLPELPRQAYFNDVRSQWLGHDKRLLELLGRPEALEPWLGDQAPVLSAAIVPTRRISQAGDFPRNSLIKPNRSGKGEGLIFGEDLSPDEWLRRLASAPAQWVVQPQLESLRVGSDRLVGCLLSKDQQALGVGIFRASPNRVVNVSGGGRVLFPMIDAA